VTHRAQNQSLRKFQKEQQIQKLLDLSNAGEGVFIYGVDKKGLNLYYSLALINRDGPRAAGLAPRRGEISKVWRFKP
jgi:hypothetical protein